eukprot:3818399-Amphidinium_carterae.2
MESCNISNVTDPKPPPIHVTEPEFKQVVCIETFLARAMAGMKTLLDKRNDMPAIEGVETPPELHHKKMFACDRSLF